MFKSKEIRWFSQTEEKQITQWFNDHGLDFATTDARTDFYLPLPEKKDMGVKLREGNIEAKCRTSIPKIGKLTDHAEGYFEEWVKWSFNVNKDDPLSESIIKEKKYSWIEVYKERVGRKLTKDEKGKTKWLSIKDRIPFGCQVEYTRILIKGQQWFTFGLEWFGNEYLEFDLKIAIEILGVSSLKKEKSMGYAEFLNMNFREIQS